MAQTYLADLFESLARQLDAGNEAIAAVGAAALRHHAGSGCALASHMPDTHREISSLLDLPSALPCAQQIKPVMDQLAWHYSGYEDGRITKDVALRMQTVELIGPRGMMVDNQCRVGLFAQTAQTDYVIRTHAAEELFVQIAGEACWMKGKEPYQTRYAGDRMHHESYQAHASRTAQTGMIALWVWAGDIDYNTYTYEGRSAQLQETKP